MALRSGLNLGRRMTGTMASQGGMVAPPPPVYGVGASGAVASAGSTVAPTGPVMDRQTQLYTSVNNPNSPGGAAYDQQMRQYGSRTGGLGVPRFGYGAGPAAQGWTANDIVSGAGMPQQAVDGQYAVNPQGKYAMGGQYFQPGTMMPRVQGWRQGVAPRAEDVAANNALIGKKEQFINTRFKDPKAAYQRMAQARARRMGIPVAGLDSDGVQQAIARGMDMRALRARGVNTNDPRVMRQFAQTGQQVGNPYAMQRFNTVMSGDAPNIGQAIESLVDAGLPPDQIRQRITGLFGSSAFDAAMEGYKNYQGMFGGPDKNKQRMWNYFNPPSATPQATAGGAPSNQLPSWIAPTTEWTIGPFGPQRRGPQPTTPQPPVPNPPPTPPQARSGGWTFGPFGFQRATPQLPPSIRPAVPRRSIGPTYMP